MSHTIEFRPSGRGKAQCQSDPSFPKGIAIDLSKVGAQACSVDLPYPALECGFWLVRCDQCPMSIAITAAGRPDDPISIKMDCGRKYN